MNNDDKTSQPDIEREKLELERYRIHLDYKKFVLGSVFVAIAIATIPPSFQLATAWLEYVKSDTEIKTKQEAFRDDYIKQFTTNALNQDIELRIRFAQYFSHVSTERYRDAWKAYLKDMKDMRDTIRAQIDTMEATLSSMENTVERDEAGIAKLRRHLNWAYNEVGYVEKDRSTTNNPRAGIDSNPVKIFRFADAVYVLLQPIEWQPRVDQSAKYEPVNVPAGFVFDLESVPRLYWSLLPPQEDYLLPSIIHSYLYWTQKLPRDQADKIFKFALEDLGIDPKTVAALYSAAHMFGNTAWNKISQLKAKGEKRVLKRFPSDTKIKWEDWKRQSDVFSDEKP